ncbi:MAG: S-layer homology domain-containing protein [Firmicutes bacterium]|nr:S-layer homology domain-containing protein [Bacillota bacterium]
MVRKLLSICLCLCLLLTLLPAQVFAAGESEGLYWRWANRETDPETGNRIYVDSHDRLRDEMSGSPGFSHDVVLVYVNAGGEETILNAADVTVEGDYIDVSRLQDGFVRVTFKSFGNDGTISYGGCSLPVICDLPDFGFYSTQTAGEDSFLTEWDYKSIGNTIYFVARHGNTLTSVSERSDLGASLNNISETCCAVTLETVTESCDLSLSFTFSDENGNGDGEETIWIAYDEGHGHSPAGDECSAAGLKIDEQDAVVGFAFIRADKMLDIYSGGGSGPSCAYTKEDSGSYGAEEWDNFAYPIRVGLEKSQEGVNTIYEDITETSELRILKVWLDMDSATGDADTFSLAPGTEQVTVLDAPVDNPPKIYYDKTHEGSVIVYAKVSVLGEEYEIWYTVTAEFMEPEVLDFSEMGSIREINLALAGMEKTIEPVIIHLGIKTYGGEGDDPAIIIPDLTFDETPSGITIEGERRENAETVVNGGIVLQSRAAGIISEVTLEARAQGEGTGVTSMEETGPYNLYACNIKNYATGMDSSNSFIGACRDNYFENNGVAVKVSLDDFGANQDQWSGNSFVNNDTAVQVTSLNDFITPYYFRLRDGEFIGNTTDFDIAQEGEYYFYRNLFATDGSTLREPAITSHAGVTIHCYPAKNFDGDLILSKKDSNTILNSIAGDLQILVSQLAGQKMTIVTDEGKGSSIVGYIEDLTAVSAPASTSSKGLRMAASSSGSEDLFTPSLDVVRSEEAVTATLQEMPSGLKLAISIPDIAWENVVVTHGDAEIEDVTVSDGMVTFTATEGGDYVISKKTESSQDPVTPTPDPIPSPSSGGGGKQDSAEPAAPVETEPGFPFTDVPEGSYFRKAVEWAFKNGVTGGLTNTTFGPKADATRAQMVTFLWAASGSPEPVNTENPFRDVSEGDYYYKAVLWALEKGITAGVTPEAFGPGQTVPRAQAITFLYSTAGRPAAGSEPFEDVADSDYFAKPVAWAFEKGITRGISETLFGPDDLCLREQIVTFLSLYFAE